MNSSDAEAGYIRRKGSHTEKIRKNLALRFRYKTTMASPATDPEFGLRHQLNAAQMTMVAVGGSIGTGLLLGTAAAIKLAGPAVILSFILAASSVGQWPWPSANSPARIPPPGRSESTAIFI